MAGALYNKDDPHSQVIDTRPKEQFFAQAGPNTEENHIQRSINIPTKEFYNEDGTLKN